MAVVLADPVHFLAHERRDDRCRHVGVVVAAQRVPDVVEQGHDDVLLVAPVAVGAGRGLQRMLQPAYGETAEIPFQQAQVVEHAIGQAAGEGPVFAPIMAQSSAVPCFISRNCARSALAVLSIVFSPTRAA